MLNKVLVKRITSSVCVLCISLSVGVSVDLWVYQLICGCISCPVGVSAVQWVYQLTEAGGDMGVLLCM